MAEYQADRGDTLDGAWEQKPLYTASSTQVQYSAVNNMGDGYSVNYGDDDVSDDVEVNMKDEEIEVDRRTASLASSVFNLANAVLGAGVLAFPAAFKDTGILAGALTTVLLVFLAELGLLVLAHCEVVTNANSYQTMVKAYLGRKASFAVELLLLLYFGGACVVYLTVIGDTSAPIIAHWLGNHFYTNRKFVITVLCLVLVFPLALLKDIQKLAFSSALAVFAVMYTVGFVVYDGIDNIAEHGFPSKAEKWIELDSSFFFSMPIICFAFQCHVSLIPIMAVFKNPTHKRRGILTAGALTICVILYITCGFFGYTKFLHKTDGDILKNYSLDSVGAGIARICIGLTATFSFPLSSFNSRLAIHTLGWKRPFKEWEYYTVTVIYVVVCLGISLFIPGITIVFDFIGSTGAVSFMFVFPGLLIWREVPGTKSLVGMILAILGGTFICVTSITVTIISLV